MKKQILAAITALALVSASTGLAQNVLWFDGFESYADTAALSGPYTQLFPTFPMLLDTGKGYNSDQSIHFGVTTANSQARAYINLPGGPQAGTDGNPLAISFMVDTDVNIWSTRQYIELRSYADGAYNAGGLQDLIALGFTSSGVDTTRVNYRVLSGPSAGWFNLTADNATRATIADPENAWTKLAMVIKTSTIEFYVNDILDTTHARNPAWVYDSLVIGSGLSSAGADVWIDNLNISIPEPSSLALSLLGGFGLLAMFRRRR